MTAILKTIDKILEQADSVRVCQDHTKLVKTSLTRLRHRLTTLEENPSSGDLVEILQTIDEIVTDCTDNDSFPKGTTYKDLETVLVRLQYRLAQYECSLTDDCGTKVQILTRALEEQQFCVMKSSDETWKQRLDAFEQQMKKTIIEKHDDLREKYPKTIESYLRACIELHQYVSIPSLTNDAVATMIKIKEQTFVRFKANPLNKISFSASWIT